MFCGKLGIDFFSTSELLYPNMKNRLRLIRARPNFYMISDNPNVSLGIVDFSLYIRRIALKHDYHKKRMDILAYAPVEYKHLETLAKTFIIPARQNEFVQENIFNNAPIRRVGIAMNKLCLHWFFYWKTILVSTIWFKTNRNTQRGTANCRFWYCWQLLSICDFHESNEFSEWYSLNPHWWF